MSEAEDLGRGLRKPKKTPGKLLFDQDIAKSKQSIETRKRNEKVRREEGEFQETEDDFVSNLPLESPSKTKPKPKPKPKKTVAQSVLKEVGPTALQDSNMDADDEETANVKDLLDHEAKVDDLICKIYTLKPQPMNKLCMLDFEELEVLYNKLLAEQSAQAPKPGAKSSKPAAKQSAKGATTLPTTTPRKVAASRVYMSKIQPMGSPIAAVTRTQEQATRAVKASQDTRKRPRNDSLSVEDVRRPRLEPQVDPKGSGTSAVIAKQPLASRRSQSSGPSGSVSSTRASSLAPTVTSAQSKSSASSRYNGLGPEDYSEVQDTIDQLEDATARNVQGRTSKPAPKKSRVTKGTFKGTAFEKLIDFAVPYTGALLVDNMCPDPNEYDLAIAEAWDAAIEYYGFSPETHAMNADHRRVVKQLFSACRSRSRKNLAEGIAAEFNLHLSSTNTIDVVKKRAADLLPTAFHRDPEAIGENAGHY
ncbi:hypothetical protein RhiJN_13197 [Ceratobasidium sp. AG-Ba]|nr:hypothetical protein RhiJN_13197 [Ceratobasidium sp. AG-Ba]